MDDAIHLASTLGPETYFLAGGTDLVIQASRGRKAPRHVIDISNVHALAGTRKTGNTFTLGALATHKTLERDIVIRERLSALAEAARVVGGHQVRNIATVGGNIANASPAADVAVALLALGAGVELTGGQVDRRVPLDEFFLGPGQTVRAPCELIKAVEIPLDQHSASAFLKAGRRKAMEISVVCVAASITMGPKGVCLAARIALGAVAATPLRARKAEAYLQGQVPSPDVLRRAGEIAAGECTPLDDVRASAAYRRILVSALVPRALAQSHRRIGMAAS